MYLPSIETHPWISMKMLKDNGVLSMGRGERNGMVLTDELEVFFDITSNRIAIKEIFDPGRTWHIGIWYKSLKYGPRPYFLCPLTRTLTTKIHFIEGQWGARSAFPHVLSLVPSKVHRKAEAFDRAVDRLFGLDGLPKAKGRNRQRLLQKVRLTPFAQFRRREVREILEMPPRRTNEERTQLQQALPFSTRAALAAGRKMRQDEVLTILDRAQVPDSGTCRPLASDIPMEILETRPTLDARELSRQGMFSEAIGGHSLVWRDAFGQLLSQSVLVVDLRDESCGYLRLIPLEAGREQLIEQVIQLDRAPHRRRWYLKCPRTGARGDVLYLRDGIFGSAASSRLIHRSQRGHSF